MIVSVIFILVSICFCIVVRKGSQIPPAHKTEKIANAINKSTLKENWKVCIDLRSSKGQEGFYCSLGFQTMSVSETEKMIGEE